MSDQNEWRYCVKCHALFYNGYATKGRCPMDGHGHEAMGYNFALPYNVPATPSMQSDWEYCVKCHGLFYNGYPDKGQCAADGEGHQHHPEAYHFLLPHNIPGTPTMQAGWEYCVKCHGMFYNDSINKGRCAADGGAHQNHPEAYRFVLPHPIDPIVNLQDRVTSISVAGTGFTPNSQVEIFYNYRDSHSLHTNGADNPIVSSTNTDGTFDQQSFNLTGSSLIAYINVKVVDKVTNIEVVRRLRADA